MRISFKTYHQTHKLTHKLRSRKVKPINLGMKFSKKNRITIYTIKPFILSIGLPFILSKYRTYMFEYLFTILILKQSIKMCVYWLKLETIKFRVKLKYSITIHSSKFLTKMSDVHLNCQFQSKLSVPFKHPQTSVPPYPLHMPNGWEKREIP